jgi:hypothetical protein
MRQRSIKEDVVILKKDVVIPAGTVMGRAPVKTERVEPFYEALIEYGNDHVAYFTFNIDGIREFCEDFECVGQANSSLNT